MSVAAFSALVEATAFRLGEWGVGSRTPVAVQMVPGIAQAALHLGVMAVGGAVLPLSPRADARIWLRLADCNRLIVDDAQGDHKQVGVRVLAASEILGDADGPKIRIQAAARALTDFHIASLRPVVSLTGSRRIAAESHSALILHAIHSTRGLGSARIGPWSRARRRCAHVDAVLAALLTGVAHRFPPGACLR